MTSEIDRVTGQVQETEEAGQRTPPGPATPREAGRGLRDARAPRIGSPASGVLCGAEPTAHTLGGGRDCTSLVKEGRDRDPGRGPAGLLLSVCVRLPALLRVGGRRG